MQKILAALRGFFRRVRSFAGSAWRFYRGLALWLQAVIGIAVIAVAFFLASLFGHAAPEDAATATRAVTLQSIAELSGTASGSSVIGQVRSRSEADILAEAGGTVTKVNASLGSTVGAGMVLAELENSTESAAMLQAEGAYDAAVAARSATSLSNTTASAEDTFRSAYASIDTVLKGDVDLFFGAETANGPTININSNGQADVLSKGRADLTGMMRQWNGELDGAFSRDPLDLLDEASANARAVSNFLNELATAANAQDSRATDAQLAGLAAARASVNGLLSTLSAATASYRSGSVSATAGSDASVKSALGALKLAQANYEKTLVRAPIGGTVNFLPIRVGDYVTNLEHVATVAENGALEIVLYVSEDVRAGIATGDKVAVENGLPGVITEIAPALDPVTKQIEVHVALSGGESASSLVNGQSVRVALPSLTEATSTSSGPVLLPLSAVKLSADARFLFTVGADGRLIALPVTIGEVRGDRIEITSPLPADARVVVDARGLSEGDKVSVAP